MALKEIRDKRLYRQHYDTFQDYCRQRWELSRPRAYQLCAASNVMRDLSTIVDTKLLPENEAQVRPLTRLRGTKHRAQAWQRAVALAAAQGRRVTAQDSLEAARQVGKVEIKVNGHQFAGAVKPSAPDERRLCGLKPYYDDGQSTTIYHGDCREILPQLRLPSVVITDPVWPNAWKGYRALKGADDPAGLLREAITALPGLPERLVVVLRLDSDPRFLEAVPASLPFFRVQILNYLKPGFIGRRLGGFEVAYCFGQPILSRPGARVVPGFSPSARPAKRLRNGHPCPRPLPHMEWLINWWAEPGDLVVDPFCGSGTTLLAARNLGRTSIGIEIEEKFCEVAAKRLSAAPGLPVAGEVEDRE